jgi:hypothetical protein
MTIPGQTVNTNTSSSTRSDSAPQAAIGDFHASHHATHSFFGDGDPLAVFEPPLLPLTDPGDLASTEKTRAALLKLAESPRDAFALAALRDENQLAIEHEMCRHLHCDSDSPLLQQLLPRLVWHARFFCDEIDNPKAWVARGANLEARRLALQLIKTR